MLLFAVPLAVIAVSILFGYVIPGMRRRRRREAPIAVVTYESRPRRAVVPPRPTREMQAISEEPATTAPAPRSAAVDSARSYAPTAATTQEIEAIPEQARAVAEAATAERNRVLRRQAVGERAPQIRDDHRSSATLRLEKASEGTLQFLPGKFEVVEGRNIGQEIRFVRSTGPDGTTITFGRSEGPPYRHVQLQEQTVSRQHAKITHDGQGWILHNASETNPVVVNGMPLADMTKGVNLRDGDRVEMGEVVLRFRTK